MTWEAQWQYCVDRIAAVRKVICDIIIKEGWPLHFPFNTNQIRFNNPNLDCKCIILVMCPESLDHMFMGTILSKSIKPIQHLNVHGYFGDQAFGWISQEDLISELRRIVNIYQTLEKTFTSVKIN
jgi:hypothetical protein